MRQLKITKSITNRESASFEKYLQEIGKEGLVSAQEEIALAIKIRDGDAQALDKLVRANLRFVVSVAKQYQNQGLSLPDLINEGNLGLIKAANRFDETRGFKFISYAVWWIRQCILQALAEQARTVKLPLNQLGLLNKVKNFILDFEQKNEREPNAFEISTALDIPIHSIETTLNLSYRDKISIDKPMVPGEDATLLDILENTENPANQILIDESLKNDIRRALLSLSEREADVVKMTFDLDGYVPMSLEEIGEKMNLTRERIRQIKDKALKTLKHHKRQKLLKKYLT